jgi:methylmalonyl-CoA/ethylmalonyl-CoA epimerase
MARQFIEELAKKEVRKLDCEKMPEVGQVAIVTKDLEKLVDYYSKMFNLGPFVTFEYTPDQAVIRGKPASFTFKLAFAPWGKMNLEIIQVVRGEVDHKEFLQRTGGGVHHLGFYVDDMQKWIDHFAQKGIPVLMDLQGTVGPRGRRRAVFFETSPGQVLFEFIKIL